MEYSGAGGNWFMKKTRGKKSRDTVPLSGIFTEVSGHKLESSHTIVVVWFSTLIYTFYKMLFMNRREFSCFADFFL